MSNLKELKVAEFIFTGVTMALVGLGVVEYLNQADGWYIPAIIGVVIGLVGVGNYRARLASENKSKSITGE